MPALLRSRSPVAHSQRACPAARAIALALTCTLVPIDAWAGEPRAEPMTAPSAAMPAGQLAASSPWQTAYYVVEGNAPGPTVLVLAGQHGDEPAGPIAAERLLGWRLCRGRLMVVPRANRAALAVGTRATPRARDPDLARNFPRARGEAPRGALAAALWQLLESARPDLILDYHEGFDFYRRGGKSIGSTVLYSPLPVAAELVPGILAAVNDTIAVASKRFDPIPKPIVGSIIDAAWRRLGIAGIVLETTKADQPLDLRVGQHLLMSEALLRALGMLALPDGMGACASRHPPRPSQAPAQLSAKAIGAKAMTKTTEAGASIPMNTSTSTMARAAPMAGSSTLREPEARANR